MEDAVRLKFRCTKILEFSSNFLRIGKSQESVKQLKDEFSLQLKFVDDKDRIISIDKYTEKREDNFKDVKESQNETDKLQINIGVNIVQYNKCDKTLTVHEEAIRSDALKILNGYVSSLGFDGDSVTFGLSFDDKEKGLEVKYKEQQKTTTQEGDKIQYSESTIFTLEKGKIYNLGSGEDKKEFKIVISDSHKTVVNK